MSDTHVEGMPLEVWLTLVLVSLAAALGAVAVHGWLSTQWSRARDTYTASAGSRLSDVFLFVPARLLWRLGLGWGTFAAVIVGWASGSAWPAMIAAAAVFRLPTLLIARLRRRRLERLEAQLPDAVRAMASAMRAGASLSAVFRHVASTARAPLAQELALVLREQRVGLSFAEAMRRFERRATCEGVTLLSATLRVASQSGGNLGALLDNVASTIQRRAEVAGRMRTLTAQGRLQAFIVGALPLALLGVLSVLSPDDMAPLWHTPRGWQVLTLLAIMETAGFLMIRRIVNIDL